MVGDNQSLKPESENKVRKALRATCFISRVGERFVITLSIFFICFFSTSECETDLNYLLIKESVFLVDLMELVGSFLRETESHPSLTTGLVCSLNSYSNSPLRELALAKYNYINIILQRSSFHSISETMSEI